MIKYSRKFHPLKTACFWLGVVLFLIGLAAGNGAASAVCMFAAICLVILYLVPSILLEYTRKLRRSKYRRSIGGGDGASAALVQYHATSVGCDISSCCAGAFGSFAVIVALMAAAPCYAGMGRNILKGATDQTTYIRIVDAADGTPETGVTSATSGIDLEYVRLGAAPTDLTESDLAATNSAHSDGGIKHVGGGVYRVDLPDAAVASGVDQVSVQGTITDMVVLGVTHQLVDMSLSGQSAADLKDFADAGYDPSTNTITGIFGTVNDFDELLSGSDDFDTAFQASATTFFGAGGVNLNALPWNASWDAEVQSEANDALQANYLQYLFASAYDPTSEPGNASGLLNRLVENDGGVPRLTPNALEQAPAGGGDSAWSADEVTQALAALSVADAANIGIPKSLIWTVKRQDGSIGSTVPVVINPEDDQQVAVNFANVLGSSDAVDDILSVTLVDSDDSEDVDSPAFDDVNEADIWMGTRVRFNLTGGTDDVKDQIRVQVHTVGGSTITGTVYALPNDD